MQLETFYNQFQQKNSRYQKLVGEENFTYFLALQLLRPLIGLLSHRSKVLDVGCGVGPISLYCAARGLSVVGIDVSNRAIAIATDAQKNLGITNARFVSGELNKKIGSFSLVIASEIIEHLADDIAFAEMLAVNLDQGGWLLLTTPSSENVLARIGWYRGFDRRVGHYRRYTKVGLTKLLRAAGFEVVYLRQVEGMLRNVLFPTRLGFLIRGIHGPLIPIFHVLDAWFAAVFGGSDWQVIARKK